VLWECVEGPGAAAGTTVSFQLSDKGEGRTTVEFDHEGWPEGHSAFATCNTLWGIFMGQLKRYAETGKPALDDSDQKKTRQNGKSITFLLDKNLGLHTEQEPLKSVLTAFDIEAESTDDLPYIDEKVASHEPDIAYIPCADFHRLTGKGDHYYRGLAIATSKFTGQPTLRSLLVVRKDDPANSLEDLQGVKYGYINRSCSSSYFPPAILLEKQGKQLEDFLKIMQVKPGPTWQGLVDAVVAKEVRATMVLEDVWKSLPKNAENTKIIGEYTGGKPPVIVVREGLDEKLCKKLLEALVSWVPSWEAVYGSFKPFYYADVHPFFHALDALPRDM
jgi:ABC-type phosphate/phosphonate transport system substrate-binding protein